MPVPAAPTVDPAQPEPRSPPTAEVDVEFGI